MATKQNPIFLDLNGNLKKIDGTNEVINEDLIALATQSSKGLMDASDKAKLDGLTSDTVNFTAGENIGQGKLCYVNSSGEAMLASNADASTKAEIIALSTVLSGSTKAFGSPNYGAITLSGVTGLTVGDTVFLGTAGAVTQSAPTATDSIVQKIGTAIESNKILVDIESIIVVN